MQAEISQPLLKARNSYFSTVIAVPRKAKQYLLATAKVIILGVTFGYIFLKLNNNPGLHFGDFLAVLTSRVSTSIYFFSILILLAAANWFFEILKWKTVVSTVECIDFKTSLKQCLASHTVAIVTPNRIGEYGAKALFFENRLRRKILLLNFFSSCAQMFITIFFGIFGLLQLFFYFKISFFVAGMGYLLAGTLLAFLFGYYFKEKELLIKGFSIAKVLVFFRKIPLAITWKTLLFASARYIIFSGMLYGLLLFFGAQLSIFEAVSLISAMYLLVSVLPTIFIFDVVMRGGVAVWLFTLAGVPELTVLSAVLTIWILNFVLPAVLGSLFVITYQPSVQ